MVTPWRHPNNIPSQHNTIAIVHIMHFQYRIAGNFRGVKYSLFLWAG